MQHILPQHFFMTLIQPKDKIRWLIQLQSPNPSKELIVIRSPFLVNPEDVDVPYLPLNLPELELLRIHNQEATGFVFHILVVHILVKLHRRVVARLKPH